MKPKSTRLFLFITTISLLILTVVFYVGRTFNIPYKTIMGDPAFVNGAHPFTGILSNIGVLFWCTTSVACIMTGLLLRNKLTKREYGFYLISGIFTLLLLVDDFFMFHDYILYSFKSLVIDEVVTYSLYVAFAIFYVVKFKSIIMNKAYLLLIIALFFLGSSIGIDTFAPSTNIKHFVEDAMKFIGIIFWTYFFVGSCYSDLHEQINQK